MATLDLPSALAAAPPGFTTVEVRVAASGEPSVIPTASGVDVPSTEWQLDAVRGLCVAYVANWAIVFFATLPPFAPAIMLRWTYCLALPRVTGVARAVHVQCQLHCIQSKCFYLPMAAIVSPTAPLAHNPPHLTNPPLYARYADMMLEVAGVDLRAMQSFDDEIRAMPGWVPLGGPRHGGGKMAS